MGALTVPRPGQGGCSAGTRHSRGTEGNHGLLARQQPDKSWPVSHKKNHLAKEDSFVKAKHVFAGADGGTPRELQKASLPEGRGQAGTPDTSGREERRT